MILPTPGGTRLDRAVTDTQAALDKLGNDSEKRAAAQEELRKAAEARDNSQVAKDYHSALDQLEEIQRSDFYGILKAMEGKPTVIRLLDPPLHEFLPSYEDLLVDTAILRERGQENTEEFKQKEHLLGVVGQMREQNPMLGLRGCRLGIMFPGIYDMQVRAILRASKQLLDEGLESHPEIMIPLVGHVNELEQVHKQTEDVVAQVNKEAGREIPFKFGTMIEIPRAAL